LTRRQRRDDGGGCRSFRIIAEDRRGEWGACGSVACGARLRFVQAQPVPERLADGVVGAPLPRLPRPLPAHGAVCRDDHRPECPARVSHHSHRASPGCGAVIRSLPRLRLLPPHLLCHRRPLLLAFAAFGLLLCLPRPGGGGGSGKSRGGRSRCTACGYYRDRACAGRSCCRPAQRRPRQ